MCTRLSGLFLLLVILILFSHSAFAALTTGNITLIKDGDGFDFESNSTTNSSFDIQVVTITGVGAENNLGFYAPNQKIAGVGPNYASVTEIYNAPPYTDPYAYSWAANGTLGYFPIYMVTDGLAVYTSSENYSVFVVTARSGNNITIEYAFLDNGSTDFFSLPSTGCYAYATDEACMSAAAGGEPCFWEWGMGICKQMQEGEYNPGGEIADCFMFDGNSNCQYINGCTWDGSELCDPNSTIFDYTNGIKCANITNDTTCNTISILPTLCSWNSSACKANSTKTKSDLPSAPYSTCEAAPNQTTCNDLIATYFMPCEWNVSGANTCGMSHTGLFGSGGGAGLFEDISTQDGCNAVGGKWITESYSYTDSQTGQFKTDTDSWCEMGFGFGFEDCDDMCWACEDGATGTNTTYATQLCEASALGFCQFVEDSNAWNGLGWCDMPMQMMWGGGGCDQDCFNCEFMNNPETECNNSAANCKWVTDQANNWSWCEKKSAKLCDTDCFACYDSTSCTQYGKGGNNTCTWDSTNYFCTPANFDGEICFDGQDNDNDGKIDCSDPDCGFDSFCGGSIFDTANCGAYPTNATCSAQNASGCLWIQDEFDLKFQEKTGQTDAGHCGMQGEQCWQYQDASNCNATTNPSAAGCRWKTEGSGFCAINESRAQSCFNAPNSSACNASSAGCFWASDPYGGGWCEFELFQCHQYMSSGDCSGAPIACAWLTDPFMPSGGFCDPFCFGFNDSQCNANSTCELRSGFCEPDFFGGNCWSYDGNMTGCQNQTQCMWMSDPMSSNAKDANVTNNGWCNDQFSMIMFQGMEAGAPVILGTDPQGCSAEAGTTNSSDICGFGLKDNPKSFGLGIQVANIYSSAACYDEYYAGSQLTGTEAGKYYYYLDTDGDSTNNCNSSDNNVTGFEFKFKYTSVYASGSVTETKLSYQCVNGSWGPVPIPLTLWKDKMCGDIGAAIVAIDKEALKKFKTLYNQTKDMRIYITTANGTTDDTTPVDNLQPVYYTPGSVDFQMEDCGAPGQDLDGDGFMSENDPDCQAFKQYGFVPIEIGPECLDGLDNDGNGKTDCVDDACKYDPFFCGGSLSSLAGDNSAPDITLHQKEVYPDGVKVIVSTNEPTNMTLEFYGNGSLCSNVNASVLDAVYDTVHVAMLDSSIGYTFTTNTTYVYKIQVCDPSNNCAKSGCTNFTTKASTSSSDCPQCSFTADFDYTASAGVNTTDPLGNIHFSFDWGSDGTFDVANDTMQYGRQINYSQGKNTTIMFQNLNSTTDWKIKLKGVDFTSSLSSTLSNLSGGFLYNESGGDSYLGMDGDKFDGILQNLGVDSIELTIPGTGDNLSHCSGTNLSQCTDITSEEGVNKTGSTGSTSTWEIPVKFGLGFSTYTVVGAGGNITYNLTFLNLSSKTQTAEIATNASYIVRLTNENNVTRVYNITGTTTGANTWINGTSSSSPLQVNLSAGNSTNINVSVLASTPGTYTTTIFATLYNNASIVLNSTPDIGALTTTFQDTTSPQLVAVTPSSPDPSTTNITSYPVTFQVNVSEINHDSVWFILNSQSLGVGSNDSTVVMTAYSGSGVLRTYSYNLSTSFTSLYTGPGAHSVYFCANDTSGNTACYSGGAVGFIMKGVNVTEMEQLFTTQGIGTMNMSFENGTDVPANTMMDPTSNNYTMTINNTDSSGNNIFIDIVGFEINESHLGNMNSTNMTSDSSQDIRNKIGGDVNVSAMGWMDIASFLPEEALYKYGRIKLPSTYDIAKYCNGTFSNATCYTISQCTGSVIDYLNHSQIIPANSACYLTSGGSTFLYLDHFSGGVGANDYTSPTITVYSPSESVYNYTITVTLNYSVSDNENGTNVSHVGYYLDDLALVILNSSVNTKTVAGVYSLSTSAGTHTLKYFANDTSNNTNPVNSSSISFTLNRQENVTAKTAEIQSSAGSGILTNIVMKNSSNDTLSDDQWLNTTLSLEFTVNMTDGLNDVTVVLPSFTGTAANWNKTDVIKVEVNASATEGTTIQSRSGSTPIKLVLFQNMSLFLSTSNYDTVRITFNQSLGDLDMLYIDDDAGNTVYKAGQCDNNVTPSSVTTASAACYVNTTTNVTLYAPHFSGGALANDTTAPTINITNPVNNTIKNNSYFTFGFDAWETNPKTSNQFCWYQVTGGSSTYLTTPTPTGTKYTFTATLSGLSNGNYNVTVNCTDLNNRSSQIYHNFTVADTTMPKVTAISTSSSGTTTVTITLSATTDENANCRYATSDVVYGNMANMGTTGSRTNHSNSVDYTSDTSGTYYVRCLDSNSQTMNTSNSTSFNADVTEGGGGGGGGGTTTTEEVVSMTKVWATMFAGSNTLNVNKAAIGLKSLVIKVKNSVSSVEVTVSKLGSRPSAVTEFADSVYQYLEVIKSAVLTDDNIEDIEIEIQVEKSWITDNSLDENTVTLQRWVSDKWTALTTTMKSDDDTYYYYTVTSPGLSYFAITAAEKVVPSLEGVVGVNETAVVEETIEESAEEEVAVEEPAQEAVEEEVKSKKWIGWLVVLIVILVGAGVAYFIIRKQQETS